MKETTVKQAIEREREVEEQGIQIQIENVSMTFKDNDGNDVQALKNINLNVKKGEFVSLVGPSGCGKTTLLRLIADLLEPSDGIVKVAGMTPREVRLQQKFGIVFQKPVLFDWRTVKKNVEMPLEIMKWRPEERSARADLHHGHRPAGNGVAPALCGGAAPPGRLRPGGQLRPLSGGNARRTAGVLQRKPVSADGHSLENQAGGYYAGFLQSDYPQRKGSRGYRDDFQKSDVLSGGASQISAGPGKP